MLGLFIFLTVAAAGLAWWRLVRAREQARSAAGAACVAHGLVLMDDTVVLDAVDTGQWRQKRALALRYRFDFARNGILNRGGKVMIAPRQPALVVISLPEGQLIETF